MLTSLPELDRRSTGAPGRCFAEPPGDGRSTALPRYLLWHSVRSYCWGAAIGAWEGWTFDARVLWCAALFHDVGLTRIPRNTMCFEVEGAELARRFLEGRRDGSAEAADRAAIAIILHMQPGVTLDDGVEAVLLDRANVARCPRRRVSSSSSASAPRSLRKYPRGRVRSALPARHRPRGRAPRRLPERRGSSDTDLAGWMARSPWATPRRPAHDHVYRLPGARLHGARAHGPPRSRRAGRRDASRSSRARSPPRTAPTDRTSCSCRAVRGSRRRARRARRPAG